MIRYQAGFCMLLQVWHGSVFPGAFKLALANATLAVVPMVLAKYGFEPAVRLLEACQEINFTVYAGFTSLIGFLVVFRTSIAYSRFWTGATFLSQMNADWFEAASSLVAFSVGSKADRRSIDMFKQTLVRLFSMLHALALAELEASQDEHTHNQQKEDDHLKTIEQLVTKRNLRLIDPLSLDCDSLQALTECHDKVELVMHWIQKLVMMNVQNGVLCAPPPIVSRAFQELSNGMTRLHNAMTIAEIPFPFPYAQANLALLTAHWVLAPLAMCGVAENAVLGGVYCFSQTFILWSLYRTAVELEDPFGDDANDLDLGVHQDKLNSRLQMLTQECADLVPASRGLLGTSSAIAAQSSMKVQDGDHAHTPDVRRLTLMTDVFSFDHGKHKQVEFSNTSSRERKTLML